MGAEKKTGKKPGNAKNGKDRKETFFGRLLSGRRFAGNTNAAVLTAAVVVVAVLLNLLFELFPINLDLTTEKLYTLTATTERVLDELQQDVTIYALYDRIAGENSSEWSRVVKVLDLYARSPRVSVEYIDTDRNPNFLERTVGAASAASYSEGDYIVKSGDTARRIDGDDMYETRTQDMFYIQRIGLAAETKLTSAIIKVTSEVPMIYYSTAFGESSVNYYGMMTGYIGDSGFDLKEINLKTEAIPEDAAALLFIGPTEDLTGEAEDKLERWLRNGGNAYFFMDIKALDGDGYIYEQFENFNRLFGIYGIRLGRGVVRESDDYAVSNTGSDYIFKTTTVTAGALSALPNSEMYIMNTRYLELDAMAEYAEPEAILQTSTGAVTSLIDSESELSGRQIIGASSRYTGGRAVSRICVFGSSGSFSDMIQQFFGQSTTNGLLRCSMEWMDLSGAANVGDSIEAKRFNNLVKSGVVVTATQQRTLAILVIVAIPVVILACGLVVWLRRRHL